MPPKKGTKLHDIIIPGKAFELAEASRKVDTDVRLSLKMGERRNKGRGYRVFAKLTNDHAVSLAKYYASLDPHKLSLVDAQAVKAAKDRLFEATGLEHKPDPRIEARKEERRALKALKNKTKAVENRGRKMREKTAKEVWKIIFPMISARHCNCELRPGMSFDELKALGAGCTDPHDYKYRILKMEKPMQLSDTDRLIALNNYSGYVCPVLDTYRRAVEKLNPPKKVTDDELA